MHGLPRKLTVDELAALFAGRTRFVERLARRENPLGVAREVLEGLPEDARVEALNAHPRIGAVQLPPASRREQGDADDPALRDALDRLNRCYERKFGFRFVVFVNRRPKSAVLRVLRDRLGRARDEELRTGLDDLVAIAVDRFRSRQGRLP